MTGSLARGLLESVDEVSVRLCDAGDGVNPAQDQLAERILVRDLDDDDDIRLSPAGVDGLDLLDLGEGSRDRARLAWLHVDHHIGPIRHDNSPVDRRVNGTGYG